MEFQMRRRAFFHTDVENQVAIAAASRFDSRRKDTGQLFNSLFRSLLRRQWIPCFGGDRGANLLQRNLARAINFYQPDARSNIVGPYQNAGGKGQKKRMSHMSKYEMRRLSRAFTLAFPPDRQ